MLPITPRRDSTSMVSAVESVGQDQPIVSPMPSVSHGTTYVLVTPTVLPGTDDLAVVLAVYVNTGTCGWPPLAET